MLSHTVNRKILDFKKKKAGVMYKLLFVLAPALSKSDSGVCVNCCLEFPKKENFL